MAPMKHLKDVMVPTQIDSGLTDSKTTSDLERFRRLAIALGAVDAVIISIDEIPVESPLHGISCRVTR